MTSAAPLTRSISLSSRSWPVACVALFFVAMGVVALADPAGILARFDVAVLSAEGRNEVRAVYGGFGLAMAGALALALRFEGLRVGTLVCAALALVGMALGRLVSWAVDGELGATPLLYFFVELGLAAALWAGLRTTPAKGGSR